MKKYRQSRHLDKGTKGMDKRVPFWDLEYSMSWGYAHDPHVCYASSGDERTNCAVWYHLLDDPELREHASPCKVKCKLCQDIGDKTDYIRGFVQHKGKREIAKPHYPVPALITEVDWWIAYPQAVVLWTLGPHQSMPWFAKFIWQG